MVTVIVSQPVSAEHPHGGRNAATRRPRATFHLLATYLRAAWPGPLFFTLGLCEARGSVCLGLGGCFLRASRFFFFRSALSLTDFVFTCRLLVHLCSTFAPLIP